MLWSWMAMTVAAVSLAGIGTEGEDRCPVNPLRRRLRAASGMQGREESLAQPDQIIVQVGLTMQTVIVRQGGHRVNLRLHAILPIS